TEELEQSLAALRGDVELDDKVARRVLLEVLAPRVPELLQVEGAIALERIRRRTYREQTRDPKHAHLALHASNQIPGVDLDDERVRLDAVVLLFAIAASVRNLDALVLPDRAAQLLEIRRRMHRAKPGLRIEQQSSACVLRTQLVHRRNGVGELVQGRARSRIELAHADGRGTCDQRERFGLARRQSGEIR